MINTTQSLKIVEAARVLSINNTSLAGIAVDTQGWNHVTFLLYSGATTGAISVFKIQDCATSGGSYVDVTGATLATLPGASDDGKIYAIHLNLRDRSIDRYLKAVITENNTGTGIYGCYAVLSDPDIAPTSATARGLTAETIT